MKEDYLWNKTGSDPEIERLETALAVFRFKAKEPPIRQAKVLSLPEKPFYRFFRFGFAFAFVASVIVVLSLVWLFASANKPISQSESVTADEPQNSPMASRSAAPSTPMVEPPASSRSFIKIRQIAATRKRHASVVARRIEDRSQPEKLTPEEKYAYGQLMLALSITSNELKIVKDKINGREERNAADDRQK